MLARTSVTRGVATLVGLVGLLLAATVAGCASDDAPTGAPTPSASASASTRLTFEVYGPPAVVEAYKKIAATYMIDHPGTKVTLEHYATHEEAMAAWRAASEDGNPPDLFLTDHDDLGELSDAQAIRPLDDLLAARRVDFGDGYARNGLEAFSADAALQCMPQDVSPMVVYYNPKLIDLDSVAEPGSNAVNQQDGWSLDEFGRAALQPRGPGVRGLYVAPDLEQVAPFIWSGGGDIVDDTENPTRLTLSSDASSSAMERLLEVVRNPALTFNQGALRKESALRRFEDGRLGMILGYRSLTPVLRAQQGLSFDVMPLPKLSGGATSSTMTGLCISSRSRHTEQAADLLGEVISDRGASTLAETGYVMPANLEVLSDDVFQQTGQRPLHADVFIHEERRVRLLPDTPSWPTVRQASSRALTRLYYQPVILPLQDRLDAIDQASIPLFDPSKVGSPTASPSTQP